MSIKLMSLAWEMDIPSTEKMVLLCLCDYANDHGGSCYPAISTLAKRTSKNARTIQRALRWLEKSKICDINERAGTSTDYTINLDAFVRGDKMSGVTKTTRRGDTTPPNPLRTTSIVKDKSLTIARKKINAKKPESVSDEVWRDWLSQRKSAFTETALEGFEREAAKAGWTLEAAITEAIERGWQGFKASWVKDKQNGNGRSNGANRASGNGPVNGFRDALRHVADGGFDEPFGYDG